MPTKHCPLLSVDTVTGRIFSTKGKGAAAITRPCSADLQAKTVWSCGERGEPSCCLLPKQDAPTLPLDLKA